MQRGSLFQIHGAEKRKARDPNDRLCREINSWWEEDERKDLVDFYISFSIFFSPLFTFYMMYLHFMRINVHISCVRVCMCRSPGYWQDVAVQSSSAEVVDRSAIPLQVHTARRDQQPQSVLQVVLRGTLSSHLLQRHSFDGLGWWEAWQPSSKVSRSYYWSKTKLEDPKWSWGEQVHGMWYFPLPCFDTVGWVTGRASGL